MCPSEEGSNGEPQRNLDRGSLYEDGQLAIFETGR